MGLSIQQREREIALLRAVAATPRQIRRMITWEAAIVGLIGSAAGIVPGAILGRELAEGLLNTASRRRTSRSSPAGCQSRRPSAAASLRRCSPCSPPGGAPARVSPTRALAQASVEPRLLSPGRVIGGLIALAGAAPLFAVAATTGAPDTAAATSEMTALFLVAAVGFLGPIVARLPAGVLGPPLARLSPVGGFLASSNLRTATRRFSSASTPLMLTVGMSCTLLFSATTIDHAVTQERKAGLARTSPSTSSGAGLPAQALADVRATPGVRSAVALTPTTLGPSPGVSDDVIPAQILSGGQGGGLDAGVTAGERLADLRGNAIARRRRADGAHAKVGDRVAVTLGDGSRQPRHRRGGLHPRARVRRRPALPGARRRPPDHPAARDDHGLGRRPGHRRRKAAEARPPVSGAAGERPGFGDHRDRRRPRDEPLARAARSSRSSSRSRRSPSSTRS